MSFFDWITSNSTKSDQLRELFNIAEKDQATWQSIETLNGAKVAIEDHQALAPEDQIRILRGLNRIWTDFENETSWTAGGAGGRTVAAHKDFRSAFLKNLPVLAISMFALIILVVILWAILDNDFLGKLTDAKTARGLITFFFALSTVGVAVILTTAAFSISAANREEMRERFDMGKQVLTALIGIFGTILGFYFGSLDGGSSTDPGQRETVTQNGNPNPGTGVGGGEGDAGGN